MNKVVSMLIAAAAMLCLISGAHAEEQSKDEAVNMLTRGAWVFHGLARTFNRDGTWTTNSSTNTNSGHWQITDTELDIEFGGGATYRFSLPLDPKGTEGLDHGKGLLYKEGEKARRPAQTPAPDKPGPAPAPEAPTPAPAPVSADVQQAASKLIQAYRDSLVFVTGAAGAGSGFIASINGSNFLITNIHVAAGIQGAEFKKLDGTIVQGGAASMAVGEDIFCMVLPAGGTPFDIMQGVDTNAAVGDPVVVLGNAEGAGVVNTIIGKIVGIGPNLVEVDAPFVPGNSGSPIIDLKSGKVIGVATYLITNTYDLATRQRLKQPIVRRFGYRLDTVKKWQAVNWRAFAAQASEMESVEGRTADLYNFFLDLAVSKGVLTTGRHTDPAIKTGIEDWIAARGSHPSPEDAAIADATFLSSLKTACRSDIDAAQNQVTYDYFRRKLADEKQTRDAMAQAFQQIIQDLGQ